LFLISILLLPAQSSGAESQWLTETIQQYGFVPSDDQRSAYLILLVVVAGFSLVSFLLSSRGTISNRRPRFIPRLGPASCLTVGAAGYGLYALLVRLPPVSLPVITASIFLAFVVFGPRGRPIKAQRILFSVIGAYVAILIVPGLLVRPIPLMQMDPVSLAQFETHLLHLPMRGAAIAAGQNFFAEQPPSYGLLMPSIMSVFETRWHEQSIASQLRFVQVCQVIFCLIGASAYLTYRPRHDVAVLIALLVAAPYWATAGLGIWHPNQTGFRSLGLPIGMLALILSARLSVERAAWCLGAVGGAAVLINMEIAIAVSAAFLVFLVLRTRTLPWMLFLRMIVASVLVLAIYLAGYPLALGRFPFSTESFDFLASLARFSAGGFGARLFTGGYEGEGYFLVPFSLLMLTHALYNIIDGFRRLGQSILPTHTALRVSISVTLIIWFAYYFNAPNWWQIWTMLFLYGFLLIDALDPRRFGFGRVEVSASTLARFARLRIAPGVFALVFFLTLMIPHTNRHLIKYMSDFMYPSWLREVKEVSVLSGVLFPRAIADELQRKAAKLEKLHAANNGNLVYLTFNMAFIPRLTGLFQAAPYRDMFAEIPGDPAFEVVMHDLLKRRPEVILLDAPTGPLAVSGPRKDFQDRVRAALSTSYRSTGSEDGWQIWRPVGAVSAKF